MLKLILGRQKSGKSTYCLDKAKESALNGGKVLYIVPEQYTFETQKKLLHKLGPAVFNKIDILSFTGLCTEIKNTYGGNAALNVDEGIRFILIKQALKQTADNLKHFNKYVNSSDFAKGLLSVVGELKTAAVDPDKLLIIAKEMSTSVFADKLHDISLILKAYNSLLGNKFVDPFDELQNTVNLMPDNSFFYGKTIIIDEFKGFTQSQYLMLDRIVSGAKDIIVSFCCDGIEPVSDSELFANVKLSANRLIGIANNCSVETEQIILEKQFYDSDDISKLEKLLCEKPLNATESLNGDISVVAMSDPKTEINFCFKTIRRLVREENYKFNDFVIIARSAEQYGELVNLTAKKFKVPCFVDTRVSAMNLPLSMFLISALRSAVSFETEEIIKMLKSGLTSITMDTVSALENYCFIWNIKGAQWKSCWLQNPEGLSNFDVDKTFENLEINEARKTIVSALDDLRKAFGGSAEVACKGVLRFFDRLGTIDALRTYTANLENNKNYQDAEYQRLGYDLLIETLDKIVSTSDGDMSADEFIELLSSSLSFHTVGEIPQTNDQVMFGTADRIRTSEPKVVFLVGVNLDRFPLVPSESGLFSSAERQILKNSDIGISARALDDSIDEKFIFYNASTLSSGKVYFCYSVRGLKGESLFPSPILNEIKENLVLSENNINGDREYLDVSDIETEDNAIILLAKHFFEDSAVVGELKEYFANSEKYKNRFNAISNYNNSPSRVVSKESVDRLFSDTITLSATKIETFNTCRFMHFCRYSLGLNPIRQVNFDALTRGNIVHYCLEKFVSRHFDDIGTLSEYLIKTETDALCSEYLSEKNIDIDNLDERFNYMLNILKQTAFFVGVALNKEFAQSQYNPVSCELRIGGKDGVIDSISATTNNGRTVGIVGSVDRVDTAPDGDVRVVDYKSSDKNFRVSDLINGLNMQMLIYLYSIIKNGRDKFSACRPTGVLYFNTKTDYSKNKRPEFIKMNGVVLADSQVVAQMERDGKGKIIPASLSKEGNVKSGLSAIEEGVFDIIFKYLDFFLAKIGSEIERGDITAAPFSNDNSSSCDYCDYKLICRAPNNCLKREKCSTTNDAAIKSILEEMEGDSSGI